MRITNFQTDTLSIWGGGIFPYDRMDGDTDKACEVTGLPKGMSDRSGWSFTRENLGKYLYHCYAAEEGSAEYMISALLHPGAYVPDSAQLLPLAFISHA